MAPSEDNPASVPGPQPAPTGGPTHGTVHLAGGTVHGPVVGVNQGTIIQGAYNWIEQIGGDQIGGDQIGGDKVLGDKIQIDQFTLVVYTGPSHPHDAEARRSLEQAYRSEVAARYAVWRSRYAPLPIQATPVATPTATACLFEREDLTFEAIRRAFVAEPVADGSPEPTPTTHTFTDLWKGLDTFGDLLLLGSPGGGKTTALWRLALDLAEAGLYRNPNALLPVFVRLGGLDVQQSLDELLRHELAHATLEDAAGRRFALHAHRTLAPLLPDLLASGRLVLLWDGLNEVPRTHFAATARALADFRRDHPGPLAGPHTRHVITCRNDDYRLLVEERDGDDPLPVTQATVQGLDAQTIRQLVRHRLGPEQGQALLDALAQPKHRTLSTLARTPLLLTMLCEVYDATGELPTNRGRLLQTFVQQRWAWEQQRHPDTWIDAPRQERALAHLAYAMTASRGRGTSVPWDWAVQHLRQGAPQADLTRLGALARQSDLLEWLGDRQNIRFTHQLIQEYFAALALQQQIARAVKRREQPLLGWLGTRALRRYAVPGERTGWEETLLLLVGIEGEGGHAQTLIRAFLSQPLQAARLVLASGADVDPALLEEVRFALLRAIADPRVTVRERIEAGDMLGTLGDPRVPVASSAWQQELAHRTERFGHAEGYWCYIRPGTYRIGGWKEGQASANIDLPAFWIARFPITVAQYAPFVDVGYDSDAECWWTTNGWRWKGDRTAPDYWNKAPFAGPNQPVIGVTWYEASAFCAWLTAQVQTALPDGYVIRLPTEAEWEAAATYDAQMQRRPYPWGAVAPTPEHAIYADSRLRRPAPVGCCPDGAAACGALDMAGNVWECTTSSYESYPIQSAEGKDFTTDDDDVPWRGGSWWDGTTYVRCGARDWIRPNFRLNGRGFRVVVSPRIVHMF